MQLNYALISSLGFAAYTYVRFGISKNDARRAEVFGREKEFTLKTIFSGIVDQMSSEGLRRRLDIMDVPITKYWSTGAIYALIGGGFFLGGFWSFAAFPVGAILGYLVHFARYYFKYMNWRDSVVADISKVITMLKIRLVIGDTVPQAIESILPVLRGNMAVEWARLVSEMSLKKPILECLDRLMDRIHDRSMSALVLRIKSYHREGVPKDANGAPMEPFGDMSEHLTRIAAKTTKYRTKKMSSSITFLAAAGLISTILWIIPFLWVIIVTPFQQM